MLATPMLSQTAKKRLPQNVNVPTYSHIFPSLSGDGNQMIFLTNYTNSEGFETKYAIKNGPETWEDPEPLTSINRPGMDHIGSFCLSYDGNFVVFASRRTPTIGNFDIWISEKIGNNWSQPVNPGKPLNSPGHEGNPSLSPDGKSIYFMRCETMDNTKKSNCAIYVSHRLSPTRWSEPKLLPDHINTGHETTPRIMADNKTLLFASGRNGGSGKLDLYKTSLENNVWTRPESLPFINSEENDEFVSVPARGDIMYLSGIYRDQYNIYMAIIPDEYRAKKVLMLTGTISYNDGQKPAEDVLVQAYDVKNGDVFTTTRLRQHDNSYTIFLPEGASYDVSVYPQKGGHTYFSQIYNLENMPLSRKEQMDVSLKSVQPGRSITLSTIRYQEYSADLTSESDIEIKRIVGFLKKNPGIRLEIGAFIDQVYTDSIQSNDLTETVADTTFYRIDKSEIAQINGSPLDEEGSDGSEPETDSLLFDEEIEEGIDTIDGFDRELQTVISPVDSIIALGYEFFDETDEELIYMKISYTYHNDRTQKQAEALMNKLIEVGVPADLLNAKGYGDDWSEDHATEERNYWIELKILNR
jgi:outer membrane protein OmpA-like peptidoglycan-associated protein